MLFTYIVPTSEFLRPPTNSRACIYSYYMKGFQEHYTFFYTIITLINRTQKPIDPYVSVSSIRGDQNRSISNCDQQISFLTEKHLMSTLRFWSSPPPRKKKNYEIQSFTQRNLRKEANDLHINLPSSSGI